MAVAYMYDAWTYPISTYRCESLRDNRVANGRLCGGRFLRKGHRMKLLYAPDIADHPDWGCRFMSD